LTVVKLIETGRSTSSVHVGPTSFIGISVASPDRVAATSGAFVSGVLSGSPADEVGLTIGDVITSLAGHSISSPTALVNTLLHYSPGTALRIRWSDHDGIAHNGTIRPVAGPPQ
jgi:S1-C subfamily serine protease